MKLDTKIYEEKMKKSIEAYKNELDTVRAGRANAKVLDRITVDYYGSPTPVNQIASISVPDARTLVIQPWGANDLKNIEKAILASDIGITPANDGKVIRLVFPQLTEDRRKELKKQVSKLGEEAKVVIRQARRNSMDIIKKAEKDGEITEDDLKLTEKDIQDLTDKYTKMVDATVEEKSKEITEL